jgi:hypothetical protein
MSALPLPLIPLLPRSPALLQVLVFTSSLAGCGTGGNVFVDLVGKRGARGLLTLRNKGGGFRPGQVGGLGLGTARLKLD